VRLKAQHVEEMYAHDADDNDSVLDKRSSNVIDLDFDSVGDSLPAGIENVVPRLKLKEKTPLEAQKSLTDHFERDD
jgi:hypothetical protein